MLRYFEFTIKFVFSAILFKCFLIEIPIRNRIWFVISLQDLFIAREILEIGVEYSVAREDVNAFERYMAMLKTYYMDYADKLEESPKKYELLGLNLLRLLSQNETAKFHTEIELLDPATIQENPYISCPVKLEQDIMEGSYKKVSNLNFVASIF